MKEVDFRAGQYVVCPAYGVGIVSGTENQEVAGTKLTVLVIVFEKSKMTVRLPINALNSKSIRRLCSKEEMKEAIDCLKGPTRVRKMMWSRRAQEYESKINSGNPIAIAEVVRDLHRSATQPEHSYSERQIYQEALDRLMREYAVVEEIDELQARSHLEKVLQEAA